MSFFFFSNCSFDITLIRKRNRKCTLKMDAVTETFIHKTKPLDANATISTGRVNLRLWLCRIVPQGHTVALDLIEALLTEVIPVSNKAIFG